MSGKLVTPRKTPRRTRASANNPDSPAEKRIEQQFGPEWSKDEIITFFSAVKGSPSGRTDWERIASDLPGRNADMVRSLFMMHKEYLALPEASSLGLFTIVKTLYNQIPAFWTTPEEATTPPNERGRGRAKNGTAAPKPREPKTPVPKQAAEKKTPSRATLSTPSRWLPDEPTEPRSRTRKQLFPDATTTTNTPTTPTTRRTTANSNPYSTPKSVTPSRKRKTPAKSDDSPPPTPTRLSSNHPSSTPDSQLPLKLRGKALKGKISPVKGSSPPHDVMHPSSRLEMSVAHTTIHDRLQKFLISPNSQHNYDGVDQPLSRAGRWAVYEWFYADVDRPFFQQNEFQDCLNELDLGKVRKLTRLEWSHVRASMGKPRRLSPAFLDQERTKLGRTRISIRQMRAGCGSPGREPFPQEIPPRLPVGSHVIAFHNHCVRRGVVHEAADDGSQYFVQLDGSPYEETLMDTDIMVCKPEEYDMELARTPARMSTRSAGSTPRSESSSSKRRKPESTPSSIGSMRTQPSPRPYSLSELRNVAALHHLLERKEALLSELTAMNNQAEKYLAQNQEYPGWFQQRYAVLIVRLEEVNQQLEPSLLHLHAARSSPAPVNFPNNYDSVTPIKSNLNSAFTTPDSDREQSTWASNSIAECRNQARSLIAEHQVQYTTTPPVREYTMSCMTLLLQLLSCAEHVQAQATEGSDAEVSYLLDSALAAVQPKAEENIPLFMEVAQSVQTLKQSLFAKEVDI